MSPDFCCAFNLTTVMKILDFWRSLFFPLPLFRIRSSAFLKPLAIDIHKVFGVIFFPRLALSLPPFLRARGNLYHPDPWAALRQWFDILRGRKDLLPSCIAAGLDSPLFPGEDSRFFPPRGFSGEGPLGPSLPLSAKKTHPHSLQLAALKPQPFSRTFTRRSQPGLDTQSGSKLFPFFFHSALNVPPLPCLRERVPFLLGPPAYR